MTSLHSPTYTVYQQMCFQNPTGEDRRSKCQMAQSIVPSWSRGKLPLSGLHGTSASRSAPKELHNLRSRFSIDLTTARCSKGAHFVRDVCVALLTSNLMMSELLQLSPTPSPQDLSPTFLFWVAPVPALGILTSPTFRGVSFFGSLIRFE
jgi:hypothetical protein